MRRKNVGGLGHTAVLIGNDATGCFFYSKNGTIPLRSSGPSNYNQENEIYFKTVQKFDNKKSNFDLSIGEISYTKGVKSATTHEQDKNDNSRQRTG